MQLSLFDNGNNEPVKKKRHSVVPSCSKHDTIQKNLDEWNTIADIELYELLYQVCAELFNATYQHKLECLDYYIDDEPDNGRHYTVMYAEIKDTWNLELKDRYDKHLDLLHRVQNNDNTLVYASDKVIITDNNTSLFNSI